MQSHCRPYRDALRSHPRVRHQGLAHQDHGGRHRHESQERGRTYHRTHARLRHHRYRSAQLHPSDRLHALYLSFAQVSRAAGEDGAAHRHREDHHQRALHLRPGEDAPPAHRRGYGAGEECRTQRSHHLAPLQQATRRTKVRHGRPQDAGVLHLRGGRASLPRQAARCRPCDHHRHDQGRRYAQLPLYRDGQPLPPPTDRRTCCTQHT